MESGNLTPSQPVIIHRNVDPWQDDGQLTLTAAYARYMKMYAITPDTHIPWIVKLIENPASPLPLSGAVTLYRHDFIHCLLGRGLTNADEAFVIGFTMGSVPKLKKLEVACFKFVSRYLYPGKFRLTKAEVDIFSDAVRLAKATTGLCSLEDFDPDPLLNKSLAEVRQLLGIPVRKLTYTMFPNN
ncbi:ubiquinone biosynthesis protein COQ4 [Chitinophaga rhizophila]|uniref:Ubiquinone biosynthesis protein COQ4 n=1 Tax=Chitinophaga rhizophila TaxID=2866212 RepID=A0ABS7GIQ0_9BACT|nr:ubiquinone biosynthesis protein COQ4 [Chitinophaga rhizophila]MBW8687196.1 ubiquinone biosynthesis protein COQ4 [Chitinophaga rhizophila]